MQEKPYIGGGYILLSRQLIDSPIWEKPPLYMKVWIYILLNARHKSTDKWERGELLLSIPQLQEVCKYPVGWRMEKPTKKQIFDVLEWLRNSHEDPMTGITTEPMIVTRKTTRGLVCKVLNYNVYQDPKNYERNYEGNAERNYEGNDEVTAREHYTQECSKNGKNDKNDDDVEFFLRNFRETTGKEVEVSLDHHKKIETLIRKYGVSGAEKVIKNIQASDYLKERATIYWISEEGNYLKVLNGVYETQEPIKPSNVTHISGSRTDGYTCEELEDIAEQKRRKFREQEKGVQ